MSQDWLHYFASGVASVLVLGFIFLYGRAIVKQWQSPTAPVKFGQPYIYISTILAGLVGGVAAMLYNEHLPAASNGPPAANATKAHDHELLRALPASGPEAAKTALANAVTFKDNLLAIVSTVYLLAYFFVGVAAIVSWIKVGDENTADLVKNLALVSIGLFVAIARTAVPH